MKIKQNWGHPNKEYNAIVKLINQMSAPVPEETKYALINDLENIIAYWEESEQNEALGNKLALFQIQLEGLGGGATTGKFCIFYLHLNRTYKHFFSLNTGNLIMNWVPLSLFYKHNVSERLSSEFNKIWNQRDLKNPNFISELGKIWKYIQHWLIFKKSNFPSFS